MGVKDRGSRSWFLLAITAFSMLLELGTIKAFGVLLPSVKEQFETQTWIIGSSISIIQGFGYTFGKLTLHDRSRYVTFIFTRERITEMIVNKLGIRIISVLQWSGGGSIWTVKTGFCQSAKESKR